MSIKQKATQKAKSTNTKSHKQVLDTTVIRNHIKSLDNKAIRNALISGGIYDKNMKLTPSYK